MKWHEEESDTESRFVLEVATNDGGWKPKGTFSSVSEAQHKWDRMSSYFTVGCKARISPVPVKVWRNFK